MHRFVTYAHRYEACMCRLLHQCGLLLGRGFRPFVWSN